MIFLEQTFKTIQVACYIVGKETDENRVYRFLLPKMLASHTKSLPTKGKMNEHLEKLYGAYFKTGVERIGDYHVMQISLTFVHPDLVSDQTLFHEALTLFKEVLDPRRWIDESIFEEEKRLYMEQHKSMIDRKRTYANYRFNMHFFKGDIYQKPLYGGLKSLREASYQTLINTWEHIVSHDQFLTVCHGVLSQEEKELVLAYMPKHETKLDHPVFSFRKPKKRSLYIKEQTDMKQAIIKMGYLLPIFRQDAHYEAAILFDTILGGFPESKLFQVIREEQGLCYDVYSNYDSYKGILTITSGVDKMNHNHAIEGIKQVIGDMKIYINDDALSHAKQYVIHHMKSSLDSQSSGTKRAFIKAFLDVHDTIDERIFKIESVTIEDLLYVYQALTLDTVYVLEGVQDEEVNL